MHNLYYLITRDALLKSTLQILLFMTNFLILVQMCPITGNRYKCQDCKEEIGFDLCEGCYNSSSKLPGRFNQHHTDDHKFTMITEQDALILSLQAEHSEEDALEDPYMENVVSHPYASNDIQRDAETGEAVPNSSNDPLAENQRDSDSTA